MDREPTIPPEIASRTNDLTLVQALTETRALARRRAAEDGEEADPRWERIAARTDRILGHVGIERDEAGHTPAIGVDRIDRVALGLDPVAKDRLAATLRALGDDVGGSRLDAVDRSLADLEDHVS
jgi:hypothetical protein